MNRIVVLSLMFVVLSIGLEVSGADVNHPHNSTSTAEPTSAATTEGHSTKPPHTSGASTTATGTTGATDVTTTSSKVTTTSSEVTTSSPGQVDIYGVQYKNKSYCILIKASISINVVYNSSKSEVVTVPAPNAVHIDGDCGKENATEQHISIKFFNETWELNLTFTKPDEKYYLSNISLHYVLNAVNIGGNVMNNTRLFETSTGYLCMARKTLYSNLTAENSIGAIYTEKLQLEAFQAKKTLAFNDKFERCSEDSISNLVPIIVGACLGGLIIIVLIAYLIGRKRSRRGYESV